MTEGPGRPDRSHLEPPPWAAPMEPQPTGPLAGFRILDVTHAAAGPFAALMLADLGADVIKVEPPGGELIRFVGPFHPDDRAPAYGARFAFRNRNKRSIVLDLHDDDDRETFLQLVETADGLIENMRAGVLDRLGVGWDVCHARNPRLVYAAIRGFGDPRTGASPYVDWPAFDPVAQAMGGFVANTGPDAEHPMRAGPTIGDLVPGLMAALGLVSALLARAAQRARASSSTWPWSTPHVAVRAGARPVDLRRPHFERSRQPPRRRQPLRRLRRPPTATAPSSP